jgi:hypothetical protein
VRFGAFAVVRLESTFRHWLLFLGNLTGENPSIQQGGCCYRYRAA